MADKVDKPKKQKAKPKRDGKGVLAALPSTRPERIGGRRSAAPKPKPKPARAKKPAAPKVAALPASAARRKPAAARKATAARAAATRRNAAAPRTFEPTAAAETAAGAADERAAGVEPPRGPATSRPRPVREGAPGIGTTTYREQPSSESGRPNGIELVTTAVQAAGELAQIGFTIGGQILKRAAERLPKP